MKYQYKIKSNKYNSGALSVFGRHPMLVVSFNSLHRQIFFNSTLFVFERLPTLAGMSVYGVTSNFYSI